MPFQYSAEFRLELCEHMLAGEALASLAEEFSISVSTLNKWHHQAQIDAGREAGIESGE